MLNATLDMLMSCPELRCMLQNI